MSLSLSLFCFFPLRQGAPVVVSFPHFYQADPKYINAVDGLNPNKEEHETYLDLQPVRMMTQSLKHVAKLDRLLTFYLFMAIRNITQ